MASSWPGSPARSPARVRPSLRPRHMGSLLVAQCPGPLHCLFPFQGAAPSLPSRLCEDVTPAAFLTWPRRDGSTLSPVRVQSASSLRFFSIIRTDSEKACSFGCLFCVSLPLERRIRKGTGHTPGSALCHLPRAQSCACGMVGSGQVHTSAQVTAAWKGDRKHTGARKDRDESLPPFSPFPLDATLIHG